MSPRPDDNIDERVTRLETSVDQLVLGMSKVDSTLAVLSDKLSTFGRPNWALMIGAITIMISVFSLGTGAMFYFMKSEITNQVTPVALKAASSETDRHKINDQISRNADDISKLRGELMATAISEKEKGVERETQIRGLSQFQNMRHAQYMQMIGVIWEKEFGHALPSNAYYPDISFPRPQGN